MDYQKMRQELNDQGYTIVRGLLTPDEVDYYISRMEALSGITRAGMQGNDQWKGTGRGSGGSSWTLPDGVGKARDFWPIAVNERLVGIFRNTVDPDLACMQHDAPPSCLACGVVDHVLVVEEKRVFDRAQQQRDQELQDQVKLNRHRAAAPDTAAAAVRRRTGPLLILAPASALRRAPPSRACDPGCTEFRACTPHFHFSTSSQTIPNAGISAQ